MKRKRFPEEQIIKILRSHDTGVPLADLAREHGFAEGTVYTWKAKYGGMEVGEATSRAGDGEQEAQEAAGRDDAGEGRAQGCPRPKVVKPAARRRVVQNRARRGLLSERAGSRLIGVSRSVVRYRPPTEERGEVA